MQVGQAKYGMQTLNQSLCQLCWRKRLITHGRGLGAPADPDELEPAQLAVQRGRRTPQAARVTRLRDRPASFWS